MERLRRVADHLVARAGCATTCQLWRAHELRCIVPPTAVPQVADVVRSELDAELELLAGADTRSANGAFTLVYRFSSRPPGPIDTVVAEVRIPPEEPTFPSLATRSFAGSRYEREIQDLLGLRAVGHPDPLRLPLHQFWPDGYFPLRRAAHAPGSIVDD